MSGMLPDGRDQAGGAGVDGHVACSGQGVWGGTVGLNAWPRLGACTGIACRAAVAGPTETPAATPAARPAQPRTHPSSAPRPQTAPAAPGTSGWTAPVGGAKVGTSVGMRVRGGTTAGQLPVLGLDGARLAVCEAGRRRCRKATDAGGSPELQRDASGWTAPVGAKMAGRLQQSASSVSGGGGVGGGGGGGSSGPQAAP